MNKRKVIMKFALPCAAVAVIGLILYISQLLVSRAQVQNHKDEFNTYINNLIEENKNYIKKVSARIKTLPPDQVIINQLQSDYISDHQKPGHPKKYLWMSSVEGEFLFGVPSADFQKLNYAFDKYQSTIKSDDYYKDRNDFLDKLIASADNIDLSQFNKLTPNENDGGRGWYAPKWRFFSESNDWDHWDTYQSTLTSYTTPVYNYNGKFIGNLYLKVDDKSNIEKYYNENRFQNSDMLQTLNIISIIVLVISLSFLWFLLPTWVYIDGQERDVKTPGIWAFFVLISLPFGLVIYLLIRPASLKSVYCPKCKGELNGTKAYCPHCGYDLASSFCQQCQYPIKPGWKYCPNCRSEVISDSTLKMENINTDLSTK